MYRPTMPALLPSDDQANLLYGIRKMLKAGLIEKSTQAAAKKDVTYQVTARGREGSSPMHSGYASDTALIECCVPTSASAHMFYMHSICS